MQTTEQALETIIEARLLGPVHSGYRKRLPSDYDRALCLDPEVVLDFIYATSQYMNSLEYQRALDWATLDCKKYEPEPASPEEQAERENDAREKMLRELERRRARQQRNND